MTHNSRYYYYLFIIELRKTVVIDEINEKNIIIMLLSDATMNL